MYWVEPTPVPPAATATHGPKATSSRPASPRGGPARCATWDPNAFTTPMRSWRDCRRRLFR
jgi:hypothetical protein